MVSVMILSCAFSSRARTGEGILLDRLFPVIVREHAVGSGIFIPGSFAASFFFPSVAGMWILNTFAPTMFGPLRVKGAPLFFYILLLPIAIVEVAADVLIPILSLPPPYGFRCAVTSINTVFFGAVLTASALSRGSEREW